MKRKTHTPNVREYGYKFPHSVGGAVRLDSAVNGAEDELHYVLGRLRPEHVVVDRDLLVVLERVRSVLELRVEVLVLDEVADHGTQSVLPTHYRIRGTIHIRCRRTLHTDTGTQTHTHKLI